MLINLHGIEREIYKVIFTTVILNQNEKMKKKVNIHGV